MTGLDQLPDARISGIPPFTVGVRVVHATATPALRDIVRSVAEYQRDRGWQVDLLTSIPDRPDAAASALRAPGPQVVVLHGSRAGLLGRLGLRCAVPTVYVPHGALHQARPVHRRAGWTWERLAARWTNLWIARDPDEVHQAMRHAVLSPFVIVDLRETPLPGASQERLAAAVSRAHAFGRLR